MVTDKQVRKLFQFLLANRAIVRSARLTDMDEKTARKYRDLGKLPSEVAKAHDWVTRSNPFEAVWSEVRELLEGNAGLQAKTIFEELQRRYPERFADTQLRTLQRHIAVWRAHTILAFDDEWSDLAVDAGQILPQPLRVEMDDAAARSA